VHHAVWKYGINIHRRTIVIFQKSQHDLLTHYATLMAVSGLWVNMRTLGCPNSQSDDFAMLKILTYNKMLNNTIFSAI
jgi:hypothetical protein